MILFCTLAAIFNILSGVYFILTGRRMRKQVKEAVEIAVKYYTAYNELLVKKDENK